METRCCFLVARDNLWSILRTRFLRGRAHAGKHNARTTAANQGPAGRPPGKNTVAPRSISRSPSVEKFAALSSPVISRECIRVREWASCEWKNPSQQPFLPGGDQPAAWYTFFAGRPTKKNAKFHKIWVATNVTISTNYCCILWDKSTFVCFLQHRSKNSGCSAIQ
jgi:hypothetical protein